MQRNMTGKLIRLATLYLDGKVADLSRCRFRREVLEIARTIQSLLDTDINTLA